MADSRCLPFVQVVFFRVGKPMNAKLPFALSRQRGKSLVNQLVDGLVGAIYDGKYKIGDTLPSYRVMAQELHVSLRIPREAVARLVADGFAKARRGLGTVVSNPNIRPVRARVLVVVSHAMSGYFCSVLTDAFREELENEGYAVEIFAVRYGHRNEPDYVRLAEVLSRPYAFALLMDGIDMDVVSMVADRGIRYFSFYFETCRRPARCTGFIRLDFDDAMRDFATDLENRGIRTVVQVDFHKPAFSPRPFLKKTQLRSVLTPLREDAGFLTAVRSGARQMFLETYCQQGAKMPDLFFFSDDYVAASAIAALYECGYATPRDFRYVTLLNEGLGFPFGGALGHVVVDSEAYGRQIARAAIEILYGRSMREDVVLKAVYRRA